MSESRYIKKAEKLLRGVKGRSLTIEERRESSVELASFILNETRRTQTNRERKRQLQVARMIRDSAGKAFTLEMTDQCFRSKQPKRVADQMVYLIKKHGIPRYLTLGRKFKLLMFKWLGNRFPRMMLFFTKRVIRKEARHVILPAERRSLKKQIKKRQSNGYRVNINHIGEAILGEEEAKKRLKMYLSDLARPEVEMVSVKISSICSQIHLLAWEESLSLLVPRLKELYRTASEYQIRSSGGKRGAKCVNLDMEEYDDLHLTVELFKRVLDDPEFHHQYGGIVLQAYLPESYLIQQQLTVWAKQRVTNGGAPIRIRIVKGANLAMERLEAALENWEQAPYKQKSDVDANFKRMLQYGCDPENSWAVNIGIGSHNLFDISYGLLLRAERGVEDCVAVEMLEGMAPSMQQVIKKLARDLVLYCPAAFQSDFHNGVAYLIRRLDENSGEENFLHYLFKLMPGTKPWQSQANMFSFACNQARLVSMKSNRTQNRALEVMKRDEGAPFQNEANTDWGLPNNRKWGESILSNASQSDFDPIPVADEAHVEQALDVASKSVWKSSLKERAHLLFEVAHLLRQKRGDLIGAMVVNTKKTVEEADVEVSEAIDFVEYYSKSGLKWESHPGISWEPKGVVVVTSPWNFPLAIPVGAISAALMGGNRVIFKPAPEARLVGWNLVQVFWEAGLSKEVLQFIPCDDEPSAVSLVADPRVDVAMLTGSTETAKAMLKDHPGLDLIGETGGKNSMIVTAMADRDLAIRDVILSAFGHAGQKCSACSTLILEAELYDDRHFMNQLCDAAKSLKVGSQFDPATRVNPLIKTPQESLKKGLTQLESGEKWLLKPEQSLDDQSLWSPGIKLGVREGSFMHKTELFGPVLGVMRADNLHHAIALANGTSYGLTAGLHSLDEREHAIWQKNVLAGNLYINRTMTGAVVQRQPFGGCKESSFGSGHKAGGPNYITQLMNPRETAHPDEKELPEKALEPLTQYLKKSGYEDKQLAVWRESLGSYAFAWNHHFKEVHDPAGLPFQKNAFSYVPREVMYRVHEEDDQLDILRVIAAAVTCGASIEVSGDPKVVAMFASAKWVGVKVVIETDEELIKRDLPLKRVRVLKDPSGEVLKAFGEQGCSLLRGPILSHGRLELLHYVREVSLSKETHRYGHIS